MTSHKYVHLTHISRAGSLLTYDVFLHTMYINIINLVCFYQNRLTIVKSIALWTQKSILTGCLHHHASLVQLECHCDDETLSLRNFLPLELFLRSFQNFSAPQSNLLEDAFNSCQQVHSLNLIFYLFLENVQRSNIFMATFNRCQHSIQCNFIYVIFRTLPLNDMFGMLYLQMTRLSASEWIGFAG